MNFDKRRQSGAELEAVKEYEEIEHIEDNEDFYIQGLPIKTEIGYCHFIRVKDYSSMIGKLSVLSYDKNRILADMHDQKKKASGEKLDSLEDSIEAIEQGTTFQLMRQIPNFDMAYQELFSDVFQDNEAWNKVDDQSFEYYRRLIAKMNNVNLPETNPNPEIQAALERAAKTKSNGENINFTTMVTSVVVGSGVDYSKINEMTVFQLNMTFKRIMGFKDYDTSTLFATVADKAEIQNWFKNYPLSETEKHGVTREEFGKTVNDVFNS